MSNSTFLALVVLSPWPIFFSFLLYYATIYDKNFNFFISNKKQAIYYFSQLSAPIGVFLYIFLSRLSNTSRSLNVYEIIEKFYYYFNLLESSDIIFILLIGLFCATFWLLALGWYYISLRKRVLALYLYSSQFGIFFNLFTKLSKSRSYFNLFLLTIVNKFYNTTETSHQIILAFWPIGIKVFENNVFRYTLPYILIFDMVIHNGCLTNIFLILPWFYIYFLMRTFWQLFTKIHTLENMDISVKMYGYGTKFKKVIEKAKKQRETRNKKKIH